MYEWIFKFPDALAVSPGDAIDNAIRQFSRDHRASLGAIKSGTVWMLNGIESLLNMVPWWVLILMVVWAGYKTSRRWGIGVLYGVMLLLIGSFGLWELMLETLSIIVVSVSLALPTSPAF